MALTHHDGHAALDCKGCPLFMSDQGIAFRYLNPRPRRSTPDPFALLPRINRTSRQLTLDRPVHGSAEPFNLATSGIVSSAQLAAALQATNFEMRKSIRFAFSQAMNVACNSMHMVVEVLKADILANPTLTMCAILKRQNLIARSGGDTIEVWPCEIIPENRYRFLSMNGTCTVEIPVGFEVHGQYHQGYVDPKTNILQQTALPTDCTLNEEVPVALNNATYTYDRHSGMLTLAPKHPDLRIVTWNASFAFPQETLIFRQGVMYNWSEIRSHVTLNDLLGTLCAQRQLFSTL